MTNIMKFIILNIFDVEHRLAVFKCLVWANLNLVLGFKGSKKVNIKARKTLICQNFRFFTDFISCTSTGVCKKVQSI